MAELDSMVRVGIVSVLDKKGKTARVYFPDMKNMVSGWLPVLQRPGDSAMPKVNNRVLVLYPSGWNMDGYILGVIP